MPSFRSRFQNVSLSLALLLSAVGAFAQQSVLTKSGDNARSGVYQDQQITVANLKTRGVTLRTTIPVIGDARGMEAQPLILRQVKMADGSIHDVLVLPSMANVVRGVDLYSGTNLWQTTLGTPVLSNPLIDFHNINQHIGVLSTGVIDPKSQLAYMVALVSPDGSPARGVHWMYTLSVATGAIVKAPVSFAGLTSGTAGYLDTPHKQRSSLVEVNVGGRDTVLCAYGAVLEAQQPTAGGIVAFDVATNRFTAYLPLSSGIWMGGQGLNADPDGFLYGVTGNGSFDGVTTFGESIIKVAYTPPATPGGMGALRVVHHFTPYSDNGRIGLDPSQSGAKARAGVAKLSGVSAPTREMKEDAAAMPVGGSMSVSLANTHTVVHYDSVTRHAVPLVYPDNPTDPNWIDEDLGSGGCSLIEPPTGPQSATLKTADALKGWFAPGQRPYLFCGGKDGIGYLTFADAMGDTMPADFVNAKANCAKLVSPPIWFTASPGDGVDACPQDETRVDFFPYGKTRHQHSTAVQNWSLVHGLVLYGWGENSTLHAWSLSSTGKFTYLAESREVASVGTTADPGGMPGGFCALSTHNFAPGTSVLWCSIPLGDANATVTRGRLIAYDADTFSNDQDGRHLVKLWDSQDQGIEYWFNKFMPPTIVNGVVLLPNYSGGVMLFTE